MDDAGRGDSIRVGSPYSGEMTISPGSTGLWAARDQVRRVARDLRFSRDESADILLAVGEALSNAYLYGSPDRDNGLIYLGWWFAGEELTITVRDEGEGFEPREASLAAAAVVGRRGHGLRLMEKGADEVSFEFDGGTRVVLKKRVPCPKRPTSLEALRARQSAADLRRC